MKPIPREEYPRPQMAREEWMNLNGEWDFSFDMESYDRKIMVPFAYQTELSGICIQDIHDTVWYRREFEFTLGSRLYGAERKADSQLGYMGLLPYDDGPDLLV